MSIEYEKFVGKIRDGIDEWNSLTKEQSKLGFLYQPKIKGWWNVKYHCPVCGKQLDIQLIDRAESGKVDRHIYSCVCGYRYATGDIP